MDKNDLVYELWLNCICGHSPKKISNCIQHFKSGKNIFCNEVDDAKLRIVLGTRYHDYAEKNLDDALEILEYCDNNNIRLLHISDIEYPNLLKNIPVPPQILYIKGERFDLNHFLTITVVGTRHCSDDARTFTRDISFDMAANGIVIVSGMAAGIDAAAQIGAINAGQRTVAVLAGGVDVVYPKENENLYEKIINCGAIISERPPEAVGRAGYYQERNRIIAGLSYGTVVVEGSKSSGSSITAGYAGDYDRDIFAVPGRPNDKNSYVPNALLRDGATTTVVADDVLRWYDDLYCEKLENGRMALRKVPATDDLAYNDSGDVRYKQKYQRKKKAVKKDLKKNKNKEEYIKIEQHSNKNESKKKEPNFEKYNNSERKILEYLNKCSEPAHIDEITRSTDLTPSEINSIILLLQMKGVIRRLAGNLYTLEI